MPKTIFIYSVADVAVAFESWNPFHINIYLQSCLYHPIFINWSLLLELKNIKLNSNEKTKQIFEWHIIEKKAYWKREIEKIYRKSNYDLFLVKRWERGENNQRIKEIKQIDVLQKMPKSRLGLR
jgi:hypothetical protein